MDGMFIEVVDITSVYMVMFLRPTGSSIVFRQQLGEGYGVAKEKNI